MAGVGKTIALIGIGHEEDIKEHFADGVLYISVGATATVAHLTSELSKIMRVTGATTSAEKVESSSTLADAISRAAIWFNGKRILFLTDDIWPSKTRPEGYLPDLEGLLQGSPDSRIVLSTRSVQVASNRGLHVDFGQRDPCGPISMAMFMAHAAPGIEPALRHLEAARSILESCSGLPIALSVAGTAGAQIQGFYSNMRAERTSREYLRRWSCIPVPSSWTLLFDSVWNPSRMNIRILQMELALSMSAMYSSLCVIDNQQVAPVSVLALMWNISEEHAEDVCVMFGSMSLAKMSTQTLDGREQCGLHIHDLHLDFCRQNASRIGEEKVWHRRMLEGHMSDDSLKANKTFGFVDDVRGFNILEYTPREWWTHDVPNTEYIRENLSRHLHRAGLELELGATMLDLRWVSAQAVSGGVFRVKNDMDILQAALEERNVSTGENEPLASRPSYPILFLDSESF